jgi:hypothetical protein
VRALRKHGLSDDVIAHREPKKSMSSGTIEVVSWPFDSLSGRATFPLSLPIGSRAITTGFYGRHATGEKSNLPHFVLTPSDTPKGIFNGREIAELIAEGGVEKLYPTEAVIDALVIKTIGYGPVISIVGTAHTEHLKRLILNLNPGEVNVALDFDSAGEEATMGGKTRQGTIRGLIPWLQDAGYRGELVNFAAAFAMNHPEVAKLDCDDFGTWWERYGRHHRQPF